MSTIRTPVGPQPAAVYWKRRAMVLIGLVAIIVVVLLIVFRPGSGAPTAATNTPKPTGTSTSTAPASDPDIADADACDPADVELTAVTDKGGYNAGEEPLISMSITNNGAKACSINAGTDAQEYIITSGSDKIWSSRDCQSDPVATPTVLQPGIAKSTAPFGWDRTRSSTTTCTGTRPEVAAGGASYHLTVKLGAITSESTRQFLLY